MGKFTDRVLLILNILAAIAMLLAYLAPLVNPAKMFFPALFGLAYPYHPDGASGLYLLLAYPLEERDPDLGHCYIAGVESPEQSFALEFKTFRDSGKHACQDSYLKVLSYNVRGFDIYHWTKEPEAKKEIFKFLEEQEPQLLCFQEYYTSSKSGQTHADISRELKYLPL